MALSLSGLIVILLSSLVPLTAKLGAPDDYRERIVWAKWRFAAWYGRVVISHWTCYLGWALVIAGIFPSWALILATAGVALNTLGLRNAQRGRRAALVGAQAAEDAVVAATPMPQNLSGLG